MVWNTYNIEDDNLALLIGMSFAFNFYLDPRGDLPNDRNVDASSLCLHDHLRDFFITIFGVLKCKPLNLDPVTILSFRLKTLKEIF